AAQKVRAAVGPPRIVAKRERHGELCIAEREDEPWSHDAGDGVRRAVEENRTADDRRIGAEPPPPQAVGEHHDAFGARFVATLDRAAGDRPRAEEIEEPAADARALEPLGVAR